MQLLRRSGLGLLNIFELLEETLRRARVRSCKNIMLKADNDKKFASQTNHCYGRWRLLDGT